jgi:hypothetical protein
MKQPIAGVVPAEIEEVDAMTVWPTIGATAAGRLVGRLAEIRVGWGFLTIGNLLVLATIPISLAVFGWQLMPYVCRRYTLTNRRILIRRGLSARDERWLNLDEFDTIDIEMLPGQKWLHAGELVFKHGGMEVLRWSGVSRPETVRHVCRKARDAARLLHETLQRRAG